MRGKRFLIVALTETLEGDHGWQARQRVRPGSTGMQSGGFDPMPSLHRICLAGLQPAGSGAVGSLLSGLGGEPSGLPGPQVVTPDGKTVRCAPGPLGHGRKTDRPRVHPRPIPSPCVNAWHNGLCTRIEGAFHEIRLRHCASLEVPTFPMAKRGQIGPRYGRGRQVVGRRNSRHPVAMASLRPVPPNPAR